MAGWELEGFLEEVAFKLGLGYGDMAERSHKGEENNNRQSLLPPGQMPLF